LQDLLWRESKSSNYR